MSFAIPSGMCGDTTNNTSLKIATSETPYPTIWSFTRNTLRFWVCLVERFYFFKVSEQYLHQMLIVLYTIVVYVSQLKNTFTKLKGVSPFRHTWTRTFYSASVSTSRSRHIYHSYTLYNRQNLARITGLLPKWHWGWTVWRASACERNTRKKVHACVLTKW